MQSNSQLTDTRIGTERSDKEVCGDEYAKATTTTEKQCEGVRSRGWRWSRA